MNKFVALFLLLVMHCYAGDVWEITFDDNFVIKHATLDSLKQDTLFISSAEKQTDIHLFFINRLMREKPDLSGTGFLIGAVTGIPLVNKITNEPFHGEELSIGKQIKAGVIVLTAGFVSSGLFSIYNLVDNYNFDKMSPKEKRQTITKLIQKNKKKG